MSKAATTNALQPSYIQDLFTSLIKKSTTQQGIELTKEELSNEVATNITQTLQEITSDVCSLDGKRFRDGYRQFVYLINQSGSKFSDIPDIQTLGAIQKYIHEVPELMKVYNTVKLYRDYEYLINTVGTMDFKGQSINKFEHQVETISPDLPQEDCNNLKSGISALHRKYAEKLSQDNAPDQSSDYQPLDADYLSDYFGKMAYTQSQKQGKMPSLPKLKAQATKLRKQTLNEIKDNICSFTSLRCNKGYDQFIDLCGLTGIMGYIDADQQSDFINQHIQNVPELQDINRAWDLYTDYLTLTDSSYKPSSGEIFYFEEKALQCEPFLSSNNIANIHYGIAVMYSKYLSDNGDKAGNYNFKDLFTKGQTSYFSHLLTAIKLTDDPETIKKCVYDSPYSHDINEQAEKACMRSLERKDLTQHDKFNLYRILYNVHLREHKNIGFNFGPRAKKYEDHEAKAKMYYNQANKYATPSEKATLDIPLRIAKREQSAYR